MSLLNLLSLTGVIYKRINQLYCRNLKRVFTVCNCALVHALSHSSMEIFSCRSSLQDSSFFTDVSEDSPTSSSYILEIKPLPWQSFTIISSSVDGLGMDKDCFYCVLIRSLNCKYLKNWLRAMLCLATISSKDIRCLSSGL